MKIASLVFSLVISVTVWAQGQVQRQVVGLNDRKVIGANNMKLVAPNMSNVPFRFRQVADAVGLMSMGCTGTHIGGGLVISAGHCFDALKVTQYRSSCAGITVSWGVLDGRQPSSVSTCRQILVMALTKSVDYALFRVNNPPKGAVKIRLQGRPQIGAPVTVFSHPFRDPLTWSSICEIRKTFIYGLYGVSVNALQHSCDTNPGSSGAAIVDAISLDVVGIHDGGISQGLSGTNYGTFIDSTMIPKVLNQLGYR